VKDFSLEKVAWEDNKGKHHRSPLSCPLVDATKLDLEHQGSV
jgi:hypothetical protein